MKKDSWIYKVFFMTFFLSIFFSFVSNIISIHANLLFVSILTLFIIIFGIIFDMIGTAALTSREATFHAKSSRKIKGAKEAIYIIKNSANVANICNDVIGDICGIISGGLGVSVSSALSGLFGINITISSIIVSALISSLTVGGKAIFKKIAIKNCDNIIFVIGKVLCIFKINK